MILPYLLLFFLFAVSRFYNFLRFPLFEDEAYYLLFAEKISANFNNYYLPMEGGVEPLFSILTALLTLFVKDTLFAGRLVNILASGFTILWIFYFSRLISLKTRVAMIVALFYIASPMIILNERTANLDTLSVSLFCWSIYFVVKSFLYPKKINFILLFIISFLSFFTKPVAFLMIPLLIFIPMYFKKNNPNLMLTIFAVVASAFAGVLLINLRHPNVVRDASRSLLLTSLLQIYAWQKIKLNLHLILIWFDSYFPLSVVFFVSLMVILKKISKSILFIIWFYVTAFCLVLLTKNFFPRHTLVLFLPAFFLTALVADYFMDRVKTLVILLIGLLLFFQIKISLPLLVNPEKAVLAKEDHFQLFEDYTSGNKIEEVNNYFVSFTENRHNKKIYIYFDKTMVYRYGITRLMENNKLVVFPKSINLTEIKNDGSHFFIANKFIPDTSVNWHKIKTIKVSGRHEIYIYNY